MSTVAARAEQAVPDRRAAEEVRVAFADAWGEMGSAWGVPPSVARVHGYFLAHRGVLTERDVREALGMSHRATAIAVAECEAWGLIVPAEDARRSGRRGPSATAYQVVEDQWVWFQRIAEQRKARETDPIRPRIERCLAQAERMASEFPADKELVELRDWLAELLGFVHLFDRAVSLVARADSREIARGFAVLARLPDASLDRLLRLLGALPEDELASTLEAISRVSPTVARRVLSAADRVARLGR